MYKGKRRQQTKELPGAVLDWMQYSPRLVLNDIADKPTNHRGVMLNMVWAKRRRKAATLWVWLSPVVLLL